MAKVYVLTSGSYSDYTIEGIFSSKKAAEHYKNEVCDRSYYYDIEEYELDGMVRDRYYYKVSINYNNFNIYRSYLIEDYFMQEKYSPNYFRFDNKADEDIVSFVIEADTLKRAEKAASERLMQIKALEDIKFPHLRKAVVVNRNGEYFYPMYNFSNGNIVLKDNELPLVDVPTEKYVNE